MSMTPNEIAYASDQYAKMFHTIAAEVAAVEVQAGSSIKAAEKKTDFLSSMTEPLSVVLQSFTPAETVMIGLSVVGLILIWQKG
jgi:transcriptional regulator